MTRHELTAGGWVELRPAKAVPERLRRPVKAGYTRLLANRAFAETVGKAQSDGLASLADIDDDKATELVEQMADSLPMLDEVNDLVVVARVASWSFGDTVTVDALLDLPGEVYDELRALCAPGVQDLMPDFGPSQDEQSPTVPSTA